MFVNKNRSLNNIPKLMSFNDITSTNRVLICFLTISPQYILLSKIISAFVYLEYQHLICLTTLFLELMMFIMVYLFCVVSGWYDLVVFLIIFNLNSSQPLLIHSGSFLRGHSMKVFIHQCLSKLSSVTPVPKSDR